MSRTDRLHVRTPEGIVFSMSLASPVIRAAAWTIDVFCIMVALQLAMMILGLLSILDSSVSTAIMILAQFLIFLGYGIIMEWIWRGQTIGKRLLRLRVMDEQGLRLRFSQIVMRNLLRAVDSLPGFYLLGGTACLFTARCQRLGDLAGGTVVIRTPKVSEPDLDQLFPDKYNSFRNYPHLIARLRQQVTPQETDIAVQALIKRDQLEPQARLDLFQEIAEHFRRHVDFPQQAVEGLSNEQYVRNLIDVLYRTPAKRK